MCSSWSWSRKEFHGGLKRQTAEGSQVRGRFALVWREKCLLGNTNCASTSLG